MKRKKNESKLKTIWFFIKKYKLFFAVILALALLSGLLDALNVGLMYPIINNAFNLKSSDNTFTEIINPYLEMIPIDDELLRYSVVFIVIALIAFIFKVIYYYLSARFSAKIVKEAKQKMFNKCISSDYQFFIDNKQGEILYKTSQAPNSIAISLQVLSDIFLHMSLAIFVFVTLLTMSWKLVIIVIIIGIIYFQLIRYISTKISYRAGKEKRETGQKERVIVTEYTSGIKQIKVFETFDYWRELFDTTIDKFWFHHRRNYFWNKLPQVLLWMVIYIAIGGAIIFIKIQYPGEFLELLPLIGTFATGIFLVLPKISQFGQFRMQFMHHMPNVEIVQDVLKEEKYSKMQNGTKVFSDFKKGIKFKNVSFSHKERDVLLKNIDLFIKKDQTTALVGPSGVGKSTIMNLILRLFDVDEGGVYVDDTNIKEFDIFTFLDKVGFVSQDTFIFNGTVKENIAFGGEYIEEEIIDAAKKANANDFIEKLPNGYDTIVGDRGMRLSGGEQQRVAIARAIIRKPKIILLDEATSSLDSVSEKMLQDAIDEISKKCTTFIIAHRLTTIKNADVIHVLDKGKIVESGTHEQLIRKKGKYWELYKIQKD
jgi:ATP-binding cassette subfamily B protein/subfamily B ATP-binding cassette protein MsbA